MIRNCRDGAEISEVSNQSILNDFLFHSNLRHLKDHYFFLKSLLITTFLTFATLSGPESKAESRDHRTIISKPKTESG